MFAERTNWNLTPNRLSKALEQRRAAGLEIIDLTVSNPTECGFVYDEKAILAALSNPASLKYQPDPKGLVEAREAVAEYHLGHSARVSVEYILLTTSTSEAYSYVLRTLCNPGDEVLIPAPGYPLFDFLADIQDVKLVRYPLIYDHGWQIDIHGLEQAITPRTRAVVVVNPNNPTGNFCKPLEMNKLSEICASRDLAIIADEVFLDYGLTANRPASFAANPEALTFTLSGISKIGGLPQMKLAWLTVGGPEALKLAALSRLEVIADSFLSVNAPIQWALPAFLGMRASIQAQILQRVLTNLAELDRKIAEFPLSSRLVVEGGWCGVLRVPVTRTDEDLAIDLVQLHGISIHPGHFYEFAQAGHLVLSLIVPANIFSTGLSTLLHSLS